MNWALFTAATAVLLSAHLLRAIRLSPLYPRHFGVRRFDLLVGLAISYAIGTVVPYRLGELGRLTYIAQRRGVRYGYVAATMAAERIADAICVGLFTILLIGSPVWGALNVRALPLLFTGGGVLGIGFAYAIRDSATARRLVWHSASIFRNDICYFFLDFFWTFSEIVTGGAIGRRRFLVLTPALWLCYLTSYRIFAAATGLRLQDVVRLLLQHPLNALYFNSGNAVKPLLLFTVAPLGLIFLYDFLSERSGVIRFFHLLFAGRYFGRMPAVPMVGDRFQNLDEYHGFLLARFTSAKDILTDFSLQALLDGKVQRLFPGGSDAVTALVRLNDQTVIRKFALGDAGKKLQAQVEWLRQNRDQLPLVDVVHEHIGDGFYSYDMPYFSGASDFYDYIHMAPPGDSRRLLSQVIDEMAALHARTDNGLATRSTVEMYVMKKAVENARQVLRHCEQWIDKSGTYLLNGSEYQLADWSVLLDERWLMRQVTNYRTACIHGDLTIENIIVRSMTGGEMYIIDPNPDNIFNTPLIDWGKLMQSLHLGYETLNRVPTCKWNGDSFQMILTRSHAYNELFLFARQSFTQRFGEATMREITFHELINYLRLTPYKLRRAPEKGLTFFACTSMLLRQYREAFG